MITISELFPLFSTGCKWLDVFRTISPQETVRMEKEYTVHMQWSIYDEYLIDDRRHRSDGPACIMYRVDDGGNVYRDIVVFQQWHKHGLLHRVDGPAVEEILENGNIRWQEWFVDGKKHRTDGPASIDYYEDGEGKINYQEWWENGIVTHWAGHDGIKKPWHQKSI